MAKALILANFAHEREVRGWREYGFRSLFAQINELAFPQVMVPSSTNSIIGSLKLLRLLNSPIAKNQALRTCSPPLKRDCACEKVQIVRLRRALLAGTAPDLHEDTFSYASKLKRAPAMRRGVPHTRHTTLNIN